MCVSEQGLATGWCSDALPTVLNTGGGGGSHTAVNQLKVLQSVSRTLSHCQTQQPSDSSCDLSSKVLRMGPAVTSLKTHVSPSLSILNI